MTKIFFIIITIISTINFALGQTYPNVTVETYSFQCPDKIPADKKAPTSEFVKLLLSGNDTLTIYQRQLNCDSGIIYKYQIYKGTKDYTIKTFYPIKIKPTKRCFYFAKYKPDKLSFRLLNSCGHPTESLEFISEFEFAVRNMKKDTTSYGDNTKFTMTIGSKTFTNKHETRRQDLSINLSNYFGCLLDPEKSKWQYY